MSAPLEEVLGAGQAVRPPEDVVRRWDLPESDRQALLRWCLPHEYQMRPLFQSGADPALVPNLAGERERQEASPGERLYTLAPLGPGRTPDADRRRRRQPSVEFFSSSVAQFVETSWRCHAAKEIAYELLQHAPGYDRPLEEHEAWFRRLHECERIMLVHIERIDGHVRADDTGTLCATVVTELTHAGN